jgi:hypothetical protein
MTILNNGVQFREAYHPPINYVIPTYKLGGSFNLDNLKQIDLITKPID